MILPDYAITHWATENVIPFNIKHVNPASLDLTMGAQIVDLVTGVEYDIERIEIVPSMAILASTVEYIKMPLDCAGVLYLKSSMARSGLDHALAGFVDPGFEGQLTLELHSHRPIILTVGQRIIQLVLYRLEGAPVNGYAGRYQGQTGPTRAKPEIHPRTRHGKPWTLAEVASLRDVYPTGTYSQQLDALPGRTWRAIAEKARALGLRRKVEAAQ